MKKILTLIVAFCTFYFIVPEMIIAQAPDNLSYQAVIRDGSDLLKNSDVTVEISILQGSADGTAVYSETHSSSTNANGLISIQIGNGESSTGEFSEIDWSAGPYFLKTETTPEGGETITGTSQILSVPYALYAKTVENETQGLPDVLSLSNSAANTGIADLADPVNDQDAATKIYVDNLKAEMLSLQNALIEQGIFKLADVDGNIYEVVKIGDQVWMAENLRAVRYNDKTPIPYIESETDWANLSTPGLGYFNNDSATYASQYGMLYNWFTVNTGKLCPTGWHVPSDDEWVSLMDYLGGVNVAGGKIKETGTSHWLSDHATNETGFTLRGGSCRFASGDYGTLKDFAYVWSSTSNDETTAWSLEVWHGNVLFVRPAYPKKDGFAVRCLKN